MKFTELNLPAPILEALKALKFEDLTPIQEATFPIIAGGRDMVGLAETGSGKTAACVIPLLPRIDTTAKALQVLVVVPTRELGLQYVNDVQDIGGRAGVVPFAIYGGSAKNIQLAKLRHGVHFLVATPGRLIDLMYDGAITMAQIRCVVLDEADELLKEGFLEDIEFILSCIRNEHQTVLFSATMPDDIKRLAQKFLRDPAHITLIADRAAPLSLEHCFMNISPEHKKSELITYLARPEVKQAIIFCNSRNGVDTLFNALRRELGGIEYIHAGLGQDHRFSIFNRFKGGKIRCLIATDVAGRGLDFSLVTHVINYDLPRGREQYTHRTGRTGRMGRKGTAFTFITHRDIANLNTILHSKKITPIWIGRDPRGAAGSAPTSSHARGPASGDGRSHGHGDPRRRGGRGDRGRDDRGHATPQARPSIDPPAEA
ncbi:MAG: DEAD/DEAH box helicase [Planctomycetota bacterium]